MLSHLLLPVSYDLDDEADRPHEIPDEVCGAKVLVGVGLPESIGDEDADGRQSHPSALDCPDTKEPRGVDLYLVEPAKSITRIKRSKTTSFRT